MNIIDKALETNRNYAKNYDPTLGKHPPPKIVVVTCMDPPSECRFRATKQCMNWFTTPLAKK